MTLGQLLILVLIVVVYWLASRLKKHEQRIEELEGKKDK
jgi:septation ring formation regulator EzrA